MKFSEAYEYHKQGKKIKRKEWDDSDFFTDENKYYLNIDNVLATDWQTIDEEVKEDREDYLLAVARLEENNPRIPYDKIRKEFGLKNCKDVDLSVKEDSFIEGWNKGAAFAYQDVIGILENVVKKIEEVRDIRRGITF